MRRAAFPFLVPVALVVASAALTSGRNEGARTAAHRVGARCADCHEGSVLPTHSGEFVQRGHGAEARGEGRASCQSCHEENSCAACHAREKPTWHSASLMVPGAGPDSRNNHARIGAARRESCGECHMVSFQRQCAECHLAKELTP
ncbi:MAG: hypothetical protein AB2A00_01360 [Myxococcota bacterium]